MKSISVYFRKWYLRKKFSSSCDESYVLYCLKVFLQLEKTSYAKKMFAAERTFLIRCSTVRASEISTSLSGLPSTNLSLKFLSLDSISTVFGKMGESLTMSPQTRPLTRSGLKSARSSIRPVSSQYRIHGYDFEQLERLEQRKEEELRHCEVRDCDTVVEMKSK